MNDLEYKKLCEFYNQVKESLTLTDYKQLLEDNGFYINSGYGTNVWRMNSGDYSVDDRSGCNLAFFVENKTFYSFSHQVNYDIYSLIQRRWELLGKPNKKTKVLKYICKFKGIPFSFKSVDIEESSVYNYLQDFGKYLKMSNGDITDVCYDRKDVFPYLTKAYHQSWLDDGITIDTMQKYHIGFYDRLQQIVIPIYDDNNNLVGTHCRNTIPEIASRMKYDHLRLLDGSEFKFNMGHFLFGLNRNKYNIEFEKTAIIFEAPKSVMQLESIINNNISVASFGMNFQTTKRDLLLEYGCENFIIAYDKQYKEMTDSFGDETAEFQEYKRIVKKTADLLTPYGNVYVVYDKGDLLDYKDSPTDKGEDVWNKLLSEKELFNWHEI